MHQYYTTQHNRNTSEELKITGGFIRMNENHHKAYMTINAGKSSSKQHQLRSHIDQSIHGSFYITVNEVAHFHCRKNIVVKQIKRRQ